MRCDVTLDDLVSKRVDLLLMLMKVLSCLSVCRNVGKFLVLGAMS